MKNLIYIGDKDSQVSSYFKEKLEKKKNRVEVFSDLKDLAPRLERNLPDLVLLNSELFSKVEISPDMFENVSAIVYAREMEIEEKLKYYQMGVKRVIVEPVSLVSYVITVCLMIIDHHVNSRKIRQHSLNYGKLQGASLQEILQNAFLEKKNLIIKVNNNGWNAKIRVFQGHIVSAFSPNLKNEEAVLKTLHLPVGKFMIRRFRKNFPYKSKISSTPAILAELKFQEKQIQKFFEKVGSNNPRFQVSSQLNKSSLSADETILLETIKKYLIFQNIQLNCPFSILKTVRILSSLLDKKLIYLEGEGEVIETLSDSDIEYLKENIFPDEAVEGRIVIFGLPSSGKSEFIRKLAGQQTKIRTIQYLDFVKIKLKKEMSLTLFGISIDENFQSVFENILAGIVAYIFLVDFNKEETFEYTKYLLNKMRKSYSVPLVVGVTNINENDEDKSLEQTRKKLDVSEEIQVLAIDPNSFKDVRNLIYNLKSST